MVVCGHGLVQVAHGVPGLAHGDRGVALLIRVLDVSGLIFCAPSVGGGVSTRGSESEAKGGGGEPCVRREEEAEEEDDEEDEEAVFESASRDIRVRWGAFRAARGVRRVVGASSFVSRRVSGWCL